VVFSFLTDIITIKKHNEVFDKIFCEPGIANEIYEYFTFFAKDYKYHPKFKDKVWDGKLHLYSLLTKTLYKGLRFELEKFCLDRNYQLDILDNDNADIEFSLIEAKEYIEKLNISKDVVPSAYEFQINAFIRAVRSKRRTILSPTGSGKSLIIYLLIRYFNVKTLLITPNTNLVFQMFNDFKEYGWDTDENCHTIFAGKDKSSNKILDISTWQSLQYLGKKHFSDYDMVIVDECHLAQAKQLKGLLEKMPGCILRYGFTGSLDDSQVNHLTLQGLFGKIYQTATTEQLIKQNVLSPFLVKCILLKHDLGIDKLDYQNELSYLCSNQKRNLFIRNLSLSLEGNTLVLFRFIDHGKALYDLIKNKTDRKVYLVYGKVEGEEREEIRKIVEKDKNAIIVGSYGCLSTGINIKSIENIIFASPYKSRIKVLQSIGRGLRKLDGKQICTLFDLGDDLKFKNKRNATLQHFYERIKLYNQEKFELQMYKFKVNEKKE